MNYLCIQFSNFRETQSLLDMIDIFKNTEIVIFNQQKIRGLKHKAKIHFLSFEKFKDFLKITKKQDKIFFIDNKINYIFPKSFTNTIKNHKYNSISIFCHTLGNNEMYLAQVMGFIPDIVTKRWRDDYIDCAELNQTSLVYEMIENIFFQKENNKTDFLRFNKYKIHSINYLVRTICVNPITLKKTFLKRPRSLSEIVYESIKNTKNKYLISGSWIIEKNQVLNEMYKHRYCEEL